LSKPALRTGLTSLNLIQTEPVHLLSDRLNPEVSLLASNSGLTITNSIDINATNGTGKTTIGAASTVFSGQVNFDGNITLQNILAGAEQKELQLSSFTGSLDGVAIRGVISEADAADTLLIRKVDTGLVTLTNANTYRGLTTVEEGILRISNSGALGSVTGGTVVDSSATLQMTGSINVTGEILELSGDGALFGNGALQSISGDNTWGGSITLNAHSRINADLGSSLTITNVIDDVSDQNVTFGGEGNVLVSGTITTGFGSMTKDGTGVLTLSGANTYTGLSDVQLGVVNIQNSTAFGTVDGGVTVAANAAVQMQGGISVGAEELSLSGTGVANDGALRNISGNNTWGGTVTLLANSRIN
jgi:autotransporter-associated beta strand protein